MIGSYRKRFKELRTQQTDELKAAVGMVRAAHAPMRERHAVIEQQADKRRQAREADREKSRGFHEATVRAWHRQQGKASDRTPANDLGRGGPSLG